MEVMSKSLFLSRDDDISAMLYHHGTNAPHAHDFIELVAIVKGEGEHIVGGERVKIKSGDVLLIDESVEHYYEVSAGEELTLCNCIFAPELLTEIITGRFVEVAYGMFLSGSGESLASGYIAVSGDEASGISEAVLKIVEELSKKDEGYLETARALLSVAIIKIMRLGMNRVSPLSDQLRFKRELIDDIIDRITLECESVSIKRLSKEMFFSPEYLSRLFKKETGCSLVSFIQSKKIERAARLIKETDLPIESVMERVGYSDKKHFYELFTKTYSVTPAAYRKGR